MTSNLQWFRLYHRIIDDEKIRLLAFEDRWHFIAICCLKADGLLDEPDGELKWRKVAVKLGVQARELDEIKRRLCDVGLVTETFHPVSWNELQYQSDASTERVRRFRERQKKSRNSNKNKDETQRNVSVTAQETETETETERGKEEAKASSKKRPSRIPEGWQPDEVFAEREGMSADEVVRQADRFRDYWRGQPGQKGVKADWDATWRNWVRKAMEGRRSTSPPDPDEKIYRGAQMMA